MTRREEVERPASRPAPATIAPSVARECGARAILAVAGICGAVLMALELSAVRLLAPWFGASTAVWTNVIGVVLLGLSVGYAFGARLSSRASATGVLGTALVAAAACVAWLPALARPIGRWFLPEGLSLDEAGELVAWGSLATASVLFLPPATLLGLSAPLATEIVARASGVSPGRAGGRVLAASTVGSLLGTFATPYWLVPAVGLSATYVGAAIVLGGLGAVLLVRARRIAIAALPAIALALASFVSRSSQAPVAPGETLLEAVESRYQSVRAVDAPSEGLRYLRVNESFDSFQSVWSPNAGFLPDGFYYNAFAYPAWWDRRERTWRVGIVGLGAGTAWRVLDGALPGGVRAVGDGAEIDAEVARVARRWLGLADAPERRTWSGVDGRVALRSWTGDFDQIVVDAYANQTEIPAHLSSAEFFELARSKLRDGGWITINVGAFGLDDPVVGALGGTLSSSFRRRALALAIPFSRNVALVARRDAEPPEPGTPLFRCGDAGIDRRLSAFELPGASRWFEPGAGVLTDDCNAIEELQRRSILRARGEP